MADPTPPTSSSSPSTPTHGPRGRGKSRGGLGKYLRARGRGRGGGRPAVFGQRLVLEGEQEAELDEEEAAELQAKFSRRQLGTNADRYVEPDPDPDEEPEPEVDMTAFFARQRDREQKQDEDIPAASSAATSVINHKDSEDDVDHTLAQMMSRLSRKDVNDRKDRKVLVAWDEGMEELQKEKKEAEAMRELKSRLQGKLLTPTPPATSKPSMPVFDARQADTRGLSHTRQDGEGDNNDMEDFLDDLLG